TNNQFESLRSIQVFLRKPPKKWVYVEKELQSDISMLFELGFTHFKFALEATGTIIQERPNAFDLIMEIS
ncbi:15660_t:CDS:1, partial [Funneliformis geosporum]